MPSFTTEEPIVISDDDDDDTLAATSDDDCADSASAAHASATTTSAMAAAVASSTMAAASAANGPTAALAASVAAGAAALAHKAHLNAHNMEMEVRTVGRSSGGSTQKAIAACWNVAKIAEEAASLAEMAKSLGLAESGRAPCGANVHPRGAPSSRE